MASKYPPNGLPIFHVQTIDKITGRTFYINFRVSDAVQAPALDFDVRGLTEEWLRSGETSVYREEYKVPFLSSPVFWSKEKDNVRHYVIDVMINYKFAAKRVCTEQVIKHYVICVAITVIEEKLNNPIESTQFGQFLGHKVDLCALTYKLIRYPLNIERTDDIVKNKIVPIGRSHIDDEPSTSGDAKDAMYELHYRPASKILTCSITTDRLPDSISFNDDRIVVLSGKNRLIDIYLPFFIDLKIPVKYKYDDKSCLFRVVFKVKEEQ